MRVTLKPFSVSQQTSSPNYLLLASLDGARATLVARNAADPDVDGKRFQQALGALHERVPSLHLPEAEDEQLRDTPQMLACLEEIQSTADICCRCPCRKPEAQLQGECRISCEAPLLMGCPSLSDVNRR